ncbi:CNDH2-like protein [Mya arenaria]|uniref:Condensin-2 complex subunit H2 n=1 Tax=Mya arenaria TaxID=6604 RepID=A0ABY7DWE0_MYAAR|nr:CNDH2-like protein [Mya arenaria]
MVISGSQEDCAESRFSHLIQPIKDLTKNWDVDIAAYLEDYLEELEHTVISFDGGATTMNFAQAAMLVQSSACVYSKKDFQLLPEMPLCLIPHDDGEKGENPLLSKKGEVLASRNDFKMNTCCIHSSGTLLLDMSHLILLHQSIQMQCDLQNRQTEYSNIDKFPKNPLKKRQGAVVPVTEQDDDDEDGDDRENILPLPNVLDDDDGDDLVDDNLFNAIDNALNDSNGAGSAYRTFEERVGEGIVVDSYEDLVRKHVEEYMASAQKYAQITELSQRVAEWEDKIMPKLEEEEKHGSFDINRYGSSVIDNLDTSHTVRFRDMVSEKPVYEICRTFLASLMLANTTNILIEEKGVLEQGMDMFELKLLSRKRHFEELQEYMAPSLSQT